MVQTPKHLTIALDISHFSFIIRHHRTQKNCLRELTEKANVYLKKSQLFWNQQNNTNLSR
jgi:hypothetical protein